MNINKDRQYYTLLYQWINVKNDSIDLSDYFKRNGYKSCAVYGMGELGRLFLRDMQNSGIVKYAIDKNAQGVNSESKVVSLSDELDNIDVIVVSLIEYYESIKLDIEKVTTIPVISLEDVLFGL